MTTTYPFPVSSNNFEGKRVLVTGGTKGIGETMVRRFTPGAASVATVLPSIKPLLAAAQELRTSRGAGYSRDHDRNVGAATFTAPLGKGTVLFQAVRGMQPCVYERFITNSLSFLKEKATASGQTTVATAD